jgi:hypothetical protein
MGMFDELAKVLERIPPWKRLSRMPAKVDDLTRRVADQENKLGGDWPPDICRLCGARAISLRKLEMRRVWKSGQAPNQGK